MTMPIADNAGEDVQKYLRLVREEQLKKLRKKLAEEESREHTHETREFAAADFDAPHEESKNLDSKYYVLWISREIKISLVSNYNKNKRYRIIIGLLDDRLS